MIMTSTYGGNDYIPWYY